MTKKEILSKAVRYLQIVDSMESTMWYCDEFRQHELWEVGLTTTVNQLNKILEEME